MHADACDPFSGDGYPEGLHGIPAVAEAHHCDGSRAERHRIAHSSAATTLHFLLESPTVKFLHLRHADAGCFIARVDRVAT